LLPQFAEPRRITVEQVDTGLFLILWGLFKKMVVADNAALIADPIFDNYADHQGLDLLLSVVAFAVQIYGDFSGYSDVARGVSRLMGFELMVNFRLPYFALNPSDFWNRWHISLSSWLRDYLYIPLGGNRKGAGRTYVNLLLTMLLGGLWHGAAWNFVIWGAFHGVILAAYRILERRPMHKDPWSGQYPYAIVLLKMAVMFVLTLLGWLIFRATSAHQVLYMLTHISFVPFDVSKDLAFKLVFFCRAAASYPSLSVPETRSARSAQTWGLDTSARLWLFCDLDSCFWRS
jgi:D-alanyl-lipoteichoic acid acyltransferase DltB (MBOAT superfamily)